MGAWFGNQILGWLLGLVYGGVEVLWDLLSTTFLVSPDVTDLPQVQSIMNTSLIVVDTCYGLMIITGGLTVMTNGTLQIRYGIGELLPRLVIGFIAANFARPLCSNLIDLANALTQGLTGDTVTNSFSYLLGVIHTARQNQIDNLLLLVVGILLEILVGMLLCTWFVRLGILIALVAIAPAGLACHGLPQTEPLAKLWWRALIGCLGTVTLQAFVLHSALTVLSDPKANYHTLGLPADASNVAHLFIVVCLLWITIKIPSLMRRFATNGGRTHNPVGLILRMMVIQTATRMLRLPALSRRGTTALSGRAARTGTRAGGYRPGIHDAVISYWRPRLPRASRTSPTSTSPTSTASPRKGPGAGGAATTVSPAPRPGSRGTSSGGPGRTASPVRPRPVIPSGVTPATVMPSTRPTWQTRTPSPSGGGTPPSPPPRHPAPRSGAGNPTRRPYRRI
jgi:hypothetical protein